jgi:hypothetical protein
VSEFLSLLTFGGILLAFLIGWSVGQASSCAVTAAKEIVHDGTGRLLIGFVLAGCLAGLISLPLSWTLGTQAGLPPEAPLHLALIAGAALLAAGALVNDACLFGSLARLAQGEVRFLAVPLGLFFGYLAAAVLAPEHEPLAPNHFTSPSAAGFLLVSVSAVLAPLAWWRLRRIPPPPGIWPLHRSMLLLGAAGSLLFVLTPGWTYGDAVRQAALSLLGTSSTPLLLPMLVAGLATIAGAISAGQLSGRFAYRAPNAATVARSLSGGALMGLGAWFVPGGNDQLLLWAVPGGSVSGLVAYVAMTGLIILFLLGRRHSISSTLIARAFGRR